MSEIMGFHTAGGDVTLKQRVTEHKINVLTNRPHTTELYYGTTGGEINILRPPTAEDENEVDDDESKERREAKVLETIYRSLVQTPITFNA